MKRQNIAAKTLKLRMLKKITVNSRAIAMQGMGNWSMIRQNLAQVQS